MADPLNFLSIEEHSRVARGDRTLHVEQVDLHRQAVTAQVQHMIERSTGGFRSIKRDKHFHGLASLHVHSPILGCQVLCSQ